MKKTFFAITLLLAAAIGLCGCSGQTATVYNVATELGYDGSESSWLSSVSGTSTQSRKLYEEAKADGYDGSYVEFLQLVGMTDQASSLSTALLSSVSVIAAFNETSYSIGLGGRPTATESTVYSAGSGVIYSLDGENGDAYIITNYHVLYDGDSTGAETIPHISDDISVYLYGSNYGAESDAIQAVYLGGTMEYDIAVLQITDSEPLKESSAEELIAENSDAVLAGDRVYAIGNAEGKGISVTEGIVSVDAEYISMLLPDEETTVSRLVMRTDAAVNHGNSGGGMFNEDGALIGIVNARSEEDGVEAFGYAIPANLALSVAQNIIDNASANSSKGALRATLGITPQVTDSRAVYSAEDGRVYKVETVAVASVGSGAANGYLKADDVVYSVRINGGTEYVITRGYMLGYHMFRVRKGDTVSFVIYRGGETKTVSIPFDSDDCFTLYD